MSTPHPPLAPAEIVRRREALGISSPALARELGVNAATVWRWEQGTSTPRGLSARQLAATLDRLERAAARRAAQRAAYAARRSTRRNDALE